MATKTFTQLTAYASTLAASDEVPIWDASAAAARKMTVANFIANTPNGGLAELGAANIFAAIQKITQPATDAGLTIAHSAVATGATGGALVFEAYTNSAALVQQGRISLYCVDGSASYASVLVFSVANAGGMVEAARLTKDKHLLVGTTNDNGPLTVEGNIVPGTDNNADLGTASFRFNDVYATNATIQTSDEREKRDIVDTAIGLAFIRALRPVQYRWLDVAELTETRTVQRPVMQAVERTRTTVEQDEAGRWVQRTTTETVQEPVVDVVDLYDEAGAVVGSHKVPRVEAVEETVVVRPASTHTRPHYGLLAREVKAVMDAQGIEDFAGYIYDAESDSHGLRYGELWGPMIKAIQEGAAIIGALQDEVAALTARVVALEAA